MDYIPYIYNTHSFDVNDFYNEYSPRFCQICFTNIFIRWKPSVELYIFVFVLFLRTLCTIKQKAMIYAFF